MNCSFAHSEQLSNVTNGVTQKKRCDITNQSGATSQTTEVRHHRPQRCDITDHRGATSQTTEVRHHRPEKCDITGGLCCGAVCESYGYHFIKHNNTWENAKKYCREKYTDLVTMHDQAAAERVSGSVPQGSINETNNLKWLEAVRSCRDQNTDLMSGPQTADWPTTGTYWIGYFRDAWFWSNGSKSSFRNWAVSEPVLKNNWGPKDPQCARLGEQGRWKTANCSETRPFICFDDHMILVKQPKTWEEALIYCRTHHHDLAVPITRQQRRMVRQRAKMADTAHVWVGVHFACFFKEWFWVDGHYVQTAKWGKGELHRVWRDRSRGQTGGDEMYAKHFEDKFDFICSV
uniref:C-type lectin domain-containing protein n=1 Tax=Knipowitschia caucasica TaxID=637954 RepID=A0AAV2KQY5_KNICA